MCIQLIFCLETNKGAATDWVYIRETIDKYFETGTQVRLNAVFMNSKTRYNHKDVVKDIKRFTKGFMGSKTQVIMCIDVDNFESNATHIKEFKDISDYCKSYKYELIWFSHDIEDVYLGKRISDSDKVSEAAKFRQSGAIDSVPILKLKSSNEYASHTSNIMTVLEKYLQYKSPTNQKL